MDPLSRRQFWALIEDIRRRRPNMSVIVATAYMEEAEQLCDYVIVIDQGKILQEGTLNKLLHGDEGMKIAEFTFENPQHAKTQLESINEFSVEWKEEKQMGKVIFNKLDSELPKFLSILSNKNIAVVNLEIRRKTLDDLFITLTGRHLHD